MSVYIEDYNYQWTSGTVYIVRTGQAYIIENVQNFRSNPQKKNKKKKNTIISEMLTKVLFTTVCTYYY